MELAHWADHTETRLGLAKRAPVPGAEGTQVLTKLRSAPLRFCLLIEVFPSLKSSFTGTKSGRQSEIGL